jgi:hypothetical protein
VIKAVRKFLFYPDYLSEYLRIRFDFPPLVAVAAGGSLGDRRNEGLTVFRRYLGHRCAAPEKKRTVRTGGSNSGELKVGKKSQEKATKDEKTNKQLKKRKKSDKKAHKLTHCFSIRASMLK